MSRAPEQLRKAEAALERFAPPAAPPPFAPPYPDPPPETPSGVRAQRWYQYVVADRLKLTAKQFVTTVRRALRMLRDDGVEAVLVLALPFYLLRAFWGLR